MLKKNNLVNVGKEYVHKMGITIIYCTQWWINIDNTTHKITAYNLYKDYSIWDLSYIGPFLQNSCKRHLIVQPHGVIYLYWHVTCYCLVTCVQPLLLSCDLCSTFVIVMWPVFNLCYCHVTCVQPLLLSCDLCSTCVIVIWPVFDHLMSYCAHYCVIIRLKYNHSQL